MFTGICCLSCFVRLSLELFSQSALVEWALGNTEQMMSSLEEVFNNANRFEDTLRAARVKLAYLRMTGNCLAEAFDYGFQVLEHLGESFPATPKNGIIVQEMLGTKQLVTGPLNESKLKSLPEMTDSTKKEAMAFLEQMLICSYQSQSIYFPLLACRMVRISVQYGWTKTSCVGKIFVRDILCSRLVLSSVGLHDGSFFLRVLQYRSRISCA